MTREEAIRILKNFSLCGVYHQLIHMNDTDSEAISMAIKALEQPEPHYDEWCDDCKEYDKERHCCPRWNRVIRQALKDAQPEQRWIPCSEGLPKTNGIYNVTRRISDGFECRNITDACYFDGSNTWHDDTRVNHERKYLTDVLAWCELPEPYTERREE